MAASAVCDVELSIYVEFAVSIVSQTRRYRESQTATSCYSGFESNLINQERLRLEWISRIQPWLVSLPHHHKSFDLWKDLKDFAFSIFFLQYTVPAMHLWNVMQEFYELDHVVCGSSEESEVKTKEWESMQAFEYLKSKKLEKNWRKSLQAIKRSTEENTSHPRLPLQGIDRSSPADRGLSIESQIASMQYGVDTLAEAWEALQRSFAENLEGIEIAQSMLSEIQVAVERRFMMVDNALGVDANMNSYDNSEQLDGQAHCNKISQLSEPLEATFKPLRRTNSIKAYAIVVFASSKRGEATLGAIFTMFVLLVVLYQLLHYLDAAAP